MSVHIIKRIFPARNRFARAQSKPGTPNRHIIASKTVGNREYMLHATKGWRSRRI